ncbi:MAG: aminodeoxychorismate lyase [Arenicellales bacterium]
MTTEQTRILVNGEQTGCISVTDRGLQFGDGVFETIRVHEGKPVWWQRHMDRLLDGCQRLHFAVMPDVDTLRREVTKLLTDFVTGTLKIIITRGNSSSGYAVPADIVSNRILILNPGLRHLSKTQQGIILGVCEQPVTGSQKLSGIKHLNRLEQVLARTECQSKGWDEGLMLDDRNRIIEGSMSNLFVWQQNNLLTPQLEQTGIKGICRERVLSLAEENGMKVEQCELDLGDLQHCDGLFVTNSLIGIWPVVQYRCQQISERQFAVNANTRLLQHLLEEDICSVN